MVPNIAVFVKHSVDCKDRFEGGSWRRCRCRKYLRWFADGKQHRQAVKTRSWDAAEDARRELEEKFRHGAAPKTSIATTRKTIEAAIKVFLTASAEERAIRRYKQLKEKGLSVTLAALLREIQARDVRDAGRTVAPLKPADDAVLIDSTGTPIEAVVATVLALVKPA